MKLINRVKLTESIKPINRVKLTESITKSIIDYAFSNHMKEGDRLPSERELSKALKVSRPLLREALRKMESLKLIEVMSGKGIFIKTPLKSEMSYLVLHIEQEKERLLEILTVRKVLEKLAIEEAIKNITDEEIKELEKLLNVLEEKQRRGDDSLEENWAFHNAIYRASRNKFLSDFLEGIKDFHLFWENPVENPIFAEKSYSFHRELFEGIKGRNIKKAHHVVDSLLDTTSYIPWLSVLPSKLSRLV